MEWALFVALSADGAQEMEIRKSFDELSIMIGREMRRSPNDPYWHVMKELLLYAQSQEAAIRAQEVQIARLQKAQAEMIEVRRRSA